MGLRTCAIAFTIGSRIVRLMFSALSSSSSALPDWSRLPPPVPPAPLAPPEDVAIIPAGMPMHTRIPSVSEGIPVVPPSPQQLWGTGSRPPSFYPQFPSTPHTGPPRSHQSVYPPPPIPPPVGSAQIVPTAFGSPAGGVIEPPSLSPHEDIVIQPTTSFPGPIVAPSDSHHVPVDPPRTGQTMRTPHMPPMAIDIESPPSPPFFPPELPFGSPPGSMTHDRRSRRSRRSPIFEPGSPRSPSRGSPGRPSRSHRSSGSPQRQGRTIFVEEAPRSRRSHRDHQSQSPSPPVFGPQPPQPSVMVRSDSRGPPRHRVPSRGTALDRPRSPLQSRSPSPERYPPPRSSRREGSRRPRSPIVFQQPGSILPPITGFQPPPGMPIAPTGPPVTFVEPPHPRRLHRSHRYYSRTPSPQTPVIIDPHGLPRSPPRSGSWDRPRHRRNFLQREGRRRRRSYERPYSRGHSYDDYDDYDAPDRHPRSRSHYPSRRHERSPARLRRSSRSIVRSHSYSPESRRSHRRHGSYAYSYGEPMSPPRTSRRSHRTFISGPVPHSSRRSPSPSVVVTHGEHVGRSYQQPTFILPGDDQSPRRPPISFDPSHRLTRPPSIDIIAPSLRSERIHEWEGPHPLVSAVYL